MTQQQNNPIEAAMEQWCQELNRRTFARAREIAAAFCAVALLLAPHPWGLVSGTLLVLLAMSLWYMPVMHLGNVVRWGGGAEAFVHDRLLMLLAESPTLDHATKKDFALTVSFGSALTYEAIVAQADRLRRSQEPGCRALAAFANHEGGAESGHEHVHALVRDRTLSGT